MSQRENDIEIHLASDDDNEIESPVSPIKNEPKLEGNLSQNADAVNDESEEEKNETPKKQISVKSLSPSEVETRISGHHKSQTVTAVTKIFEKGEQPATDKNEIWAWYLYDFANSPYAGVAIAFLIPLLLTDLAEEYGCSHTKYGCDINAHNLENGELIQVYVGGWELKATSYSASMIGIASLVQAFVFFFIGPLADYGRYRTLLFRITSITTGIATSCFIFFGDNTLWQLAGWWTVIGNVIFGLSIIFYNSWLPIIVETHPDVITACKENIAQNKIKRIIEQKTDHFALVGFAWGYVAGMIVLVICLGLLLAEKPSYIESDIYGTNINAFIHDINEFNELWARDITSGNIYYSVAQNDENKHFVYMNGLQFIYNGIDGGIHGESNKSLVDYNKQFNFSKGVDELIIYIATYDDHICGLSFHSIGDDMEIYSNIGNVTEIEDVIIANKISEQDMVFGGISGNVGELKDNINISINERRIISQISVLFVNEEGQFRNGKNTLNERIGIFINGIWYIFFSLISIKYLKHRPGPPLPEGEKLYYFGFKQTLKTLRKAKEYPTMFKYLLAYFLFSDGVGTLISCGVLFGRELLNMSNSQLAFMVLEVYVFGSIGTVIFLKIEKKYNVESKKMLCFHLMFLTVLPIWGLIGLIPSSPVGMKVLPEIYIWTFLLAIHVGSVQSFARSVFAQLIPVGHESEMFALFEVTDKGSSWIGPLIFAVVSDATDMRWAVFYIMFFFLIPLPVIWKLNMDDGRYEAGRSPEQVTKRASLLFDDKTIKYLKKDLQDIVEKERKLDTNNEKENIKKNGKHQLDTSKALEMAIDQNLTITNDIFDEEP